MEKVGAVEESDSRGCQGDSQQGGVLNLGWTSEYTRRLRESTRKTNETNP